jgi:hypothetical protein
MAELVDQPTRCSRSSSLRSAHVAVFSAVRHRGQTKANHRERPRHAHHRVAFPHPATYRDVGDPDRPGQLSAQSALRAVLSTGSHVLYRSRFRTARTVRESPFSSSDRAPASRCASWVQFGSADYTAVGAHDRSRSRLGAPASPPHRARRNAHSGGPNCETPDRATDLNVGGGRSQPRLRGGRAGPASSMCGVAA